MRNQLEEYLRESRREPDFIEDLRNIVKDKSADRVRDPKTNKKVFMDMVSASAILRVYDSLSDKNKKKFTSLSLPKMAETAFKLIK